MADPTRVRLTPAAATRFPDLAGREGTVGVAEFSGGKTAWVLVLFDEGGQGTWLPLADLVFDESEEAGLPPLDPSDPNAPAP